MKIFRHKHTLFSESHNFFRELYMESHNYANNSTVFVFILLIYNDFEIKI